MKRYITGTLLILFFAVWGEMCAQTRSEQGLVFNSAAFDVFVLKADSVSLSKLHLVRNTGSLKHADFVQQSITANDSDIFLMNACVSNSTCSPEGLFVEGGKEVMAVNLKDGAGNFYLKPNGALLITTNGRAAIVEAAEVSGYTNIGTGVQSGPMLVVNGSYNQQIKRGSANKNIRCGVGMYSKEGDSFLVFAISNEAVNFYDFAALFKEHFGCSNALCLESAGCAMYLPFVSRRNPTDKVVICNYIRYAKN